MIACNDGMKQVDPATWPLLRGTTWPYQAVISVLVPHVLLFMNFDDYMQPDGTLSLQVLSVSVSIHGFQVLKFL